MTYKSDWENDFSITLSMRCSTSVRARLKRFVRKKPTLRFYSRLVFAFRLALTADNIIYMFGTCNNKNFDVILYFNSLIDG